CTNTSSSRLLCIASPSWCPFSFCWLRPPRRSTLFPYTTLFRSDIFPTAADYQQAFSQFVALVPAGGAVLVCSDDVAARELLAGRSEEHTSELQSRENLVCRLLLEKKNRVG